MAGAMITKMAVPFIGICAGERVATKYVFEKLEISEFTSSGSACSRCCCT